MASTSQGVPKPTTAPRQVSPHSDGDDYDDDDDFVDDNDDDYSGSFADEGDTADDGKARDEDDSHYGSGSFVDGSGERSSGPGPAHGSHHVSSLSSIPHNASGADVSSVYHTGHAHAHGRSPVTATAAQQRAAQQHVPTTSSSPASYSSLSEGEVSSVSRSHRAPPHRGNDTGASPDYDDDDVEDETLGIDAGVSSVDDSSSWQGTGGVPSFGGRASGRPLTAADRYGSHGHAGGVSGQYPTPQSARTGATSVSRDGARSFFGVGSGGGTLTDGSTLSFEPLPSPTVTNGDGSALSNQRHGTALGRGVGGGGGGGGAAGSGGGKAVVIVPRGGRGGGLSSVHGRVAARLQSESMLSAGSASPSNPGWGSFSVDASDSGVVLDDYSDVSEGQVGSVDTSLWQPTTRR